MVAENNGFEREGKKLNNPKINFKSVQLNKEVMVVISSLLRRRSSSGKATSNEDNHVIEQQTEQDATPLRKRLENDFCEVADVNGEDIDEDGVTMKRQQISRLQSASKCSTPKGNGDCDIEDREYLRNLLIKKAWWTNLSLISYIGQEIGAEEEDLGDRSDARKDEQLILNTIFKVPYETERVLTLGSMINVDAILAALTVLPLKIIILFSKIIIRRNNGLKASDISSTAWISTLFVVSYILTRFDISFIYHIIRSQDTIKLYVVFNILDILDKLFLSFNTDTFEAMSLRAGTCTKGSLNIYEKLKEGNLLLRNWLVSTISIFIHGLVILCQAVTLNVALNTSNKGLLPLLISNQFMEVKGFVFKRMDYKRLFNITCQDIAERTNIFIIIVFVVVHSAIAATARNTSILVSKSLLHKLVVIALCEYVVDWMKHAFLSKFNSLPPTTYRRFLGDIAKSRSLTTSLYSNKTVRFVPLAHAAVVVRLLTSIHRVFPVSGYWPYWISGVVVAFIIKILFGIMMKMLSATIDNQDLVLQQFKTGSFSLKKAS